MDGSVARAMETSAAPYFTRSVAKALKELSSENDPVSQAVENYASSYFTPRIVKALEELSCEADIRKGSTFAAGVDIPTKNISFIDTDDKDPNYVFVLVELYAIRGLDALRAAEESCIVAKPMVLMRSGIGIACRASCLGQALLRKKNGDTAIFAYVRLLAEELSRLRDAPFAMQVIMCLEGLESDPRATYEHGESPHPARSDVLLVSRETLGLYDISEARIGWNARTSRSMKCMAMTPDAVTWVMLTSTLALSRWDGVSRLNERECVCAGVIDCDYEAKPSVYVSDAQLHPLAITANRFMACARAFANQLGAAAEKQRDQRSREDVTKEMKSFVQPPVARKVVGVEGSLPHHMDVIRHMLASPDDDIVLVRAITRIVLETP